MEIDAQADGAEARHWARYAERTGGAFRPAGSGFAFDLGGAVRYAMGIGEAEGVSAAAEFYRERGVPAEVECSPLADGATFAALAAHDFGVRSFANLLARPLIERHTISREDRSIHVEAADASRRAVWIELGVRAFGEQPGVDVARALELSFDSADVAYIGSVEGRPAGIAALAWTGGTALLYSAATLPDLRRMGVHRALLRKRIMDAAEAGCEVAAMKVLPASGAQRAALRAGFRVLFSKARFVCRT